MRKITDWVLLIALVATGRISEAQVLDSHSAPAAAQQLHHFEGVLEAGPPLSLETARREALERDPALAALNAQMAAARQRVIEARVLAPPMIEGQIWQWPIGTLNPAKVDMYMLSVGQEFPGRGKRALRAAVAEKDIALLDADKASRTRELIEEVAQTYVELFGARQAIAIHQNTLSLLQQVVAVTQVRYESGAVSQYDVIAGVVELSKLHEDLIQLGQEHQLTAGRLNALRQRDPDAPIGRVDAPLEPPLLRPLNELQQAAIEHHPAVTTARTTEERAVAMQAEARGDFKPDVRVSAGYMARPSGEDGWLASVGLTWPKAPWSRKKVEARVAEAAAEQEAALAKERGAATAIRLSVHNAYTRASAAAERVQLLRTTLLPQSKQAVEVSSIAYQSNRADLQAVLNEQRMLRDSELGYYRALTEAHQAIAELQRLVGGDVTIAALTARQ